MALSYEEMLFCTEFGLIGGEVYGRFSSSICYLQYYH